MDKKNNDIFHRWIKRGRQGCHRPPWKSQVATCLRYTLSQACPGKSVVRSTDRLDMSLAVYWDVKNQTKQIKHFVSLHLSTECFTWNALHLGYDGEKRNALHGMLYTWAMIERNWMLYMACFTPGLWLREKECFTWNALHLGYDREKQNALHAMLYTWAIMERNRMLYTECFTPGLW